MDSCIKRVTKYILDESRYGAPPYKDISWWKRRLLQKKPERLLLQSQSRKPKISLQMWKLRYVIKLEIKENQPRSRLININHKENQVANKVVT